MIRHVQVCMSIGVSASDPYIPKYVGNGVAWVPRMLIGGER